MQTLTFLKKISYIDAVEQKLSFLTTKRLNFNWKENLNTKIWLNEK